GGDAPVAEAHQAHGRRGRIGDEQLQTADGDAAGLRETGFKRESILHGELAGAGEDVDGAAAKVEFPDLILADGGDVQTVADDGEVSRVADRRFRRLRIVRTQAP